jgi:hypothetical protein
MGIVCEVITAKAPFHARTALLALQLGIRNVRNETGANRRLKPLHGCCRAGGGNVPRPL